MKVLQYDDQTNKVNFSDNETLFICRNGCFGTAIKVGMEVDFEVVDSTTKVFCTQTQKG